MVFVYIRSRRRAMSQAGHPALTCNPNGEVQGNAFGPAGQLERWELEAVHDGNFFYVTLRGSNGKYLSAAPCGSVHCHTANRVGDSEKWFLRNCPTGGFVTLRSFHGKYLSSECRFDCGKKVRAERNSMIDWCQWIVVDDPMAMTNKTTVGKVAVFSIYTASVFLPILPALGLVTATKRSVAYGGSTSTFSVILLEDETHGRLIKIPITFSRDETSQRELAAASSLIEASVVGKLGEKVQPQPPSDKRVRVRRKSSHRSRRSQTCSQ